MLITTSSHHRDSYANYTPLPLAAELPEPARHWDVASVRVSRRDINVISRSDNDNDNDSDNPRRHDDVQVQQRQSVALDFLANKRCGDRLHERRWGYVSEGSIQLCSRRT